VHQNGNRIIFQVTQIKGSSTADSSYLFNHFKEMLYSLMLLKVGIKLISNVIHGSLVSNYLVFIGISH